MDYRLIRNMLAPYLVDYMPGIQEVKRYTLSISPEDAFDKKIMTVINNILGCLETCEAIKNLASTILDEADFFADSSIHKTTKNKYLDKIIADSDYIEHTKAFNLSVIQTYVERIIHKQLYEINIKIEENQRSLNKIEATSVKMREDAANQNQALQIQNQALQNNNIQQQVVLNQQNRQTQNISPPNQTDNRQHDNNQSSSEQNNNISSSVTSAKKQVLTNSSPQQPAQSQHSQKETALEPPDFINQHAQPQPDLTLTDFSVTDFSANVAAGANADTEAPKERTNSQFLLVEIDQEKCAINYSNIIEILKFDKPIPEKSLKITPIPHNKLVGFARGSTVLKRVEGMHIDKKQLLNNINSSMANKDAKSFAVITKQDDNYNIVFVDYIVYAEPVTGQEMAVWNGEYIKTTDGEYKVFNT